MRPSHIRGVRAGILAGSAWLLCAAWSHADTAAPIDANNKVESAVFAASTSAQRAWIDASLARRFANGKEARRENTVVSVAVPDLVYDNGSIVLVTGDSRIACATVSGNTVSPTGACTIEVRTEERPSGGPRPVTRNHLVVAVRPAH